MAETKVMKCTCNNTFQDTQYGKNMRLFNPIGKGNQDAGFRCTVCNKEVRAGEAKKK